MLRDFSEVAVNSRTTFQGCQRAQCLQKNLAAAPASAGALHPPGSAKGPPQSPTMTQAQKPCSDSGPTVRLVFLGAAGVGKTALIQRFLTGRFESRHRRTVEELHSLDCELGPRRVSLEVLDTSGSYAFPAMRKLSIRRAQAVALVFSLAEPGSFEEVQRLREEVAELRAGEDPPLPVMVVGNQADLFPGGLLCRPPLAEHLAATAELEWGCTYLETSAKQDYNVQRLFQDLLLRVQLPSCPSPALRRRRWTDGQARVGPQGRLGGKRPSCSVQ